MLGFAQDRAPPVVSAGYRPSPVAVADTCTPEERNKERARKAARTRAQRYGATLSATLPSASCTLYRGRITAFVTSCKNGLVPGLCCPIIRPIIAS